MSQPRSDFLAALAGRGYIHQCSDTAAVDDLAARGALVAYVGYDCTAPSLHVGHLLSIMMLAWLQRTAPASRSRSWAAARAGRRSVGAGRDAPDPLRRPDRGQQGGDQGRLRALSDVRRRAREALMVDNALWLAPLNYIEFLREVGRHFSVNRMLSMDSAKLRLEREQELSFIEFNYMLLQAYDFVELARRTGCNLQMGGSDQWGNIVTGIDLGRRMGTHALYALTCPLLTTASGAKMGKTAAGAVWLNEDQLSLRVLPVLAQHRGRRRGALPEALHDAAAGRDRAPVAPEGGGDQRGQEGAGAGGNHPRARTGQGGDGGGDGAPDVRGRRGEPRSAIRHDPPRGSGGRARRARRQRRRRARCLEQRARRQIRSGGLRVNDVVVTDEARLLTPADLTAEGVIKLSLGRKKHVLLKPA